MLHCITWWRHDMETLSALLAICDRWPADSPTFFPSQRPGNLESWWDLWCQTEQTVQQTVELSVIWIAMTVTEITSMQIQSTPAIERYGCEKTNPPISKKAEDYRPLDLTWTVFSGCYTIYIYILCNMIGGCWWLGAYSAPVRLQPPWWRMAVDALHECPSAMDAGPVACTIDLFNNNIFPSGKQLEHRKLAHELE